MTQGELGRNYSDGETIFREGEKGDVMYAIQSGTVKITKGVPPGEITIATLKEGDIFGEMALFDRLPRSANAVAFGESCVLSIDKKKLFTTINRDPTLVFKMLESMSHRIRRLNEEMAKLQAAKTDITKMCPALRETCEMVLIEAERIVKAENGSLMLLDEASKTLVIMAAFGVDLAQKAQFKEGSGIAGDVLRTGRAELINNVREDARFVRGALEINSLLCIPLKCDNEVFGVINMSRSGEKKFSLDELSILSSLSLSASLAIQNAKNFTRLKNATDGMLRHATVLTDFAVGDARD